MLNTTQLKEYAQLTQATYAWTKGTKLKFRLIEPKFLR